MAFVIIAHRGNSARAPENTIYAFDAALDAGFPHFETDCQLTADGVVAVLHDEQLGRTTPGAQGAISAMAWSELESLDAGIWFGPGFPGARVPSLDPVLLRYRGRAHIHLELKSQQPDLPARVADRLRCCGWLPGPIAPGQEVEQGGDRGQGRIQQQAEVGEEKQRQSPTDGSDGSAARLVQQPHQQEAGQQQPLSDEPERQRQREQGPRHAGKEQQQQHETDGSQAEEVRVRCREQEADTSTSVVVGSACTEGPCGQMPNATGASQQPHPPPQQRLLVRADPSCHPHPHPHLVVPGLTITSFHLPQLQRSLQVLPRVTHGWLVHDLTDDVVRTALVAGIQQVCPRANVLTGEAVQRAVAAGLSVRAWGVKDMALLHHVVGCGCHGATVNWPAEAREALQSQSQS